MMEGRRLTNALLVVLVVALVLLAAGIAVAIAGRPERAPVPQLPPEPAARYLPPTGSNEIFREPTSAAAGHELIVADLRMPPEAVGEPHSHPWEEYLYILEGSVELEVSGRAPRALEAGSKLVIPARTMHTPRAGPQGVRAIIVRVHDEGDPVSTPVVGG